MSNTGHVVSLLAWFVLLNVTGPPTYVFKALLLTAQTLTADIEYVIPEGLVVGTDISGVNTH